MADGAKSEKRIKKEGMGTIALLILLGLTLLPLILAPLSFMGATDTNEYSIFNQSSNGLSKFKNNLPSNHDVYTLMSSYNELAPNKTSYPLNQMILISVGPKKLYNPTEMMALAEFLGKGGKMLLAMDFGTANEMLYLHDLFTLVFSIMNSSVYGNTIGAEYKNGIVTETDSNFYDTSSDSLKLWGPCINTHSITSGVSNLKMIRVSYLSNSIFGSIDSSSIIVKSTSTAFFDTNGNGLKDANEESAPTDGFPLIITAFNDNVIIVADADIFSNALYNEYDNSVLASNIITLLSRGQDCAILFDEVHQVKIFPNMFGIILSFVNANNTFLFSLPITPLLIYNLIKRFIPTPKKPKIQTKSQILRRKGKTLYGERMKWFKERREYNKAITLLARRLKRTMIQSLELKHYDINAIINQVRLIKPNANINRIKYGLKKIEDIEKNKKKIKEEYEFLNLYHEMRWISDAISK